MIDDGWRQRVEAEHVPFPNAHVATLKSANSEVPCHEGTDPRRPGDDSIVIDSHGASPAALALLVLLFGVILELYSARAKVTDGMVRCSATVGITRSPKGGRLCLVICMSRGSICRRLHGRLAVGGGGGWTRVVKMQGLLFRPVRQWSSALLQWWR
jgi:hypothetical protein